MKTPKAKEGVASTVDLAQLRVRQYKQRRRLAGVSLKAPNLLYEAFEEAADLANYLGMAGEELLSERALKLGDAIAKKLAQQQKAAGK